MKFPIHYLALILLLSISTYLLPGQPGLRKAKSSPNLQHLQQVAMTAIIRRCPQPKPIRVGTLTQNTAESTLRDASGSYMRRRPAPLQKSMPENPISPEPNGYKGDYYFITFKSFPAEAVVCTGEDDLPSPLPNDPRSPKLRFNSLKLPLLGCLRTPTPESGLHSPFVHFATDACACNLDSPLLKDKTEDLWRTYQEGD